MSPQRQLAVLSRIHDLAPANCQSLIATHSPILMAYPDAFVYACSDAGLARVEFEQIWHFRVMREFLSDPQRALRQLPDR